METYHIAVDRILTSGMNAFFTFFEWAEMIPDALPVFEGRMESSDWTDGEGIIVWPGKQRGIFTDGPAEARRLGFLVCEVDEGWSALIPVRRSWRSASWYDAPGDCMVMRAQRRIVDGEELVELRTHKVSQLMRVTPLDDFGWTVAGHVSGPDASVTYGFDAAKFGTRDSGVSVT